jgi:alanine-glyoxylate transaminase/serine-glyoxylate transaminase/serine-pyruvate transaminase
MWCSEMLWAGLEKMGLKCHVAIEHRLPSLTTVCIPDGIDGKALCTCVGHTHTGGGGRGGQAP